MQKTMDFKAKDFSFRSASVERYSNIASFANEAYCDDRSTEAERKGQLTASFKQTKLATLVY